VLIFDVSPQSASATPRRPALYGRLVDSAEDLPVTRLLAEPLVPADHNSRVAVVPLDGPFDTDRLIAGYEAQRAQDTDLVVFPGAYGVEGWQVDLPHIEAAVRAHRGAVVFAVASDGCTHYQSSVLITPGTTVEHIASHGRGITLSESLSPIVTTPAGNGALLCGEEGLVPEAGRCLMLEGAEILAWSLFSADPMAEAVARTRSDENKVYTAAAWPGGGLIVEPSGAPLVHVPAGTGVAMAAQVNKAVTRWKDRAPGTNMVRDRIPAAYQALVR
jgi:hypothetical protein